MIPNRIGNASLMPSAGRPVSKPEGVAAAGSLATNMQALSPQFGGLANGLSSVVEWIDSSKAIELVTTDVMGMVLPRTAIEYQNRGADAGRETLIREIAGTIFNVFLAGWIGLGTLAIFDRANKRSATVNPLGVHGSAWVNAKSMNAFQKLFEDSLAQGGSSQAVRERFVKSFITSLTASDPYILEAATGVVKQIDPALGEMVAQELKQPLTGKLTPEGMKALEKLYTIQDGGVANLQEQVARFRNSLLNSGENLSETEMAKLVTQKRLQASAASLGSVEEGRVVEALYKAAHGGGLASEVSLVNANGEKLLGNRNLKSTLREFKHALEQYFDRALANPETGKLTKAPLSPEATARIRETLQGKGLTFLEKYIPGFGNKAEMGLIPYAMKARWLLTAVPLLMTIGVSVSVSFINNWITQRKHGGQVFFPGEGGPGEGKAMPKGNPVQGPAFGPSYGPALVGNDGGFSQAGASPFEVFQRHRGQLAQGRGV